MENNTKHTKFNVCYTVTYSEGYFDTKEEAEEVLNQLQETYDDCWIEEETFEEKETPEIQMPKVIGYAVTYRDYKTQEWVKLKQCNTMEEAQDYIKRKNEELGSSYILYLNVVPIFENEIKSY